MKFIEDKRNKFKGKEIWILGTGPSLDDYPGDFFDDKISIAMKWTGMVFPKCTYNMSSLKELQLREFLRMHPKLFRKHIFAWRENLQNLPKKEYRNIPLYIKTKRYKEIRSARHPETAKVKGAFLEGIDYIKREKQFYAYAYAAVDTILHIAIPVATILGAKKITIVGCQDKCSPDFCYAQNMKAYYLGKAVPGKWEVVKREFPIKGPYPPERIERIWNCKTWKGNRRATRWLAQRLKKYGVEVALFHYKDSQQYKADYLKLA